MKVGIPGHIYILNNLEKGTQQIKFHQYIERDGVLITQGEGTTNEEVLEMMIDRMQHLQKTLPCREYVLAITKLEEALMWLNKRAENRKKRKVKNTRKP